MKTYVERGPIFRKALESDYDAVAELYSSVRGSRFCTWNDEYPTEVEIEYDLKHGTLYVLETERCIIGAISVIAENELDALGLWKYTSDCGEIARVVVAPAHHGYGYGAMMVKKIEEMLEARCAAIHLLAAIRNTPAVRTYLKCGYEIRGNVEMYGNTYYACEKHLEG